MLALACTVIKRLAYRSPSGLLDSKCSSKRSKSNATECFALFNNMVASNVNNAIVVLKQMLSKPSFSVLFNPLVTTSPNKFLTLIVALDSTIGRGK